MKPSEIYTVQGLGWTRYTLARDDKGETVNVYGPNVQSVCVIGALLIAFNHSFNRSLANGFRDDLFEEVRQKLEKHIGIDSVTWNNAPERTKEEVIAALVAIGE